MKRLLIGFAAIAMMLSSTDVFAQGRYGADSIECIKYLSYYSEYYKNKNYDEAIPSWRKAYSVCPPTARQSILVDGTVLVRRLIQKNFGNVSYRKELIDTLMTLHDLRVQYYPKYAATALNNKGTDVSNYFKNDPQRCYDEYEAIKAANGVNTKTSLLVLQFQAAQDLFEKGVFDAEKVIETYQENASLIEKAPAKDAKDVEANAKAKTDLESLFMTSNVASCDNLLALYTPRFAANPDDLQLAEQIMGVLGRTEGCTDNDLFMRAATTVYKMNPSYSSAYFLFKLNASRGKSAEAVKYMEEAIAYDESDSATDANYYYELAVFSHKHGMNAKAFESARKAAELDSSLSGKCYFLIGSIWGSTTCGGDEIERRAPYWVAVDYLQKAKNADPTLAEDANRLISQFAKYYPETAEAFMYNLSKGESFTVRCGGMTAVTTVRTQD